MVFTPWNAAISSGTDIGANFNLSMTDANITFSRANDRLPPMMRWHQLVQLEIMNYGMTTSLLVVPVSHADPAS